MRPIELAFFKNLAEIASSQSLPYFRKPIIVENKDHHNFDPVTEADRNVEKYLRSAIIGQYPNDGILGEELANYNVEAEYLWVLDPIDGTRSFITGMPIWGTLVGLTYKKRALAGMMVQPYIGEIFYSLGAQSFYLKQNRVQLGANASLQEKTGAQSAIGYPLRTRQCKDIGDAVMFTTDPCQFQSKSAAQILHVLESRTRLTRYSADCYAFCMLAAGLVDVVIEIGMKTYDVMALIPIVEQAGGIITCWDGSRPESAGNIVAAGTPELHNQVLGILGEAADVTRDR